MSNNFLLFSLMLLLAASLGEPDFIDRIFDLLDPACKVAEINHQTSGGGDE